MGIVWKIVEASWTKDDVSHLYLSELNGLIPKLQELYQYSKKIAEEKIDGKKAALLKEAWQKAIRMN